MFNHTLEGGEGGGRGDDGELLCVSCHLLAAAVRTPYSIALPITCLRELKPSTVSPTSNLPFGSGAVSTHNSTVCRKGGRRTALVACTAHWANGTSPSGQSYACSCAAAACAEWNIWAPATHTVATDAARVAFSTCR